MVAVVAEQTAHGAASFVVVRPAFEVDARIEVLLGHVLAVVGDDVVEGALVLEEVGLRFLAHARTFVLEWRVAVSAHDLLHTSLCTTTSKHHHFLSYLQQE